MIAKLIMNGESETLEFKESFKDEALETIGAFSNAQGGTLLIGVRDSGKVSGVQIGKKTLEDWSHTIQEVAEPRVQPSIEVHQSGKKSRKIKGLPAETLALVLDGKNIFASSGN